MYQSGDKVYRLWGKQIAILNPETYEVTHLDLKEELDVLDKQLEEWIDGAFFQHVTNSFRFAARLFTVVGNYLYFAQQRGSQVGMINLETKKLEWHTDIEITNEINPTIQDIQANETHLFVLDHASTLHIFEKE